MGAIAFNRWLGTPSTICFLRRVLSATEETSHHISRTHKQGSEYHARSYSDASADVVRRNKGGSRTELSRHHRLKEPEGEAPRNAPQTTLSNIEVAERATRALWEHADAAARRAHAQPVHANTESRQDIRGWMETLQRRQRLDGFAGTYDVWKGMRYRGIDLPVKGIEADFLWSTLIDACSGPEPSDARHELRKSVLEHAKDLYTRSGVLYAHLYRLVMRCAFRTRSRDRISKWHKEFMHSFGAPEIDLRTLAADFAATQNALGCQRGFRAVYGSSDQRNLYDSFIPALLLTGDDRFSLYWHRQFIKRGDGPSTEMFATAGVQRLFQLDEDKTLPMVHRKSTLQESILPRGAQFPALTRASMSSMVGEAHGIKPKEVSDTFVAKLFATNAFPLDMVLKGLSFFSIERLGPLALHELVIRAGSKSDLKDIFRELKTAGVDVGDSVYGKVLQQVVDDGPDELFDILVASDQHPEAYEDLKTQGRLLAVFLAEGNLQKAHLALIALSSGGASFNVYAWNLVLQHYIMDSQYRTTVSTYQQMQLAGVTVENRSLRLMRRHFLSPRASGKGPSPVEPSEKESKRPLQITTNMCIYAAQNGTPVHHSTWRELLRRYGMMNKWNELEHLVRWLVSWYSPKSTADPKAHHQVDSSQLSAIFTGQMLQAVVTWGFNNAAERRLLSNISIGAERSTSHGHCEPWAQGLMLLKQLSTQGLYVVPETVRNALLIRLWIMFGPAWTSKASNEQYKWENELPLAHFVHHADHIWDQKLFNVNPELLLPIPGTTAELMITLFGPIKRVSRKRKEFADVVGYAHTYEHRRQYFIRNGLRRARAWYYSPFRLPATTNTKLDPDPITLRAPRQSPFAHSMNSHPPPNPADTPALHSPYSPLPQSDPPK
ncbi:hypothetical protein DOTSEDRAFT_71521 [Dothistroma septosporum NZE10]|uniref:Uncharacterized protein n=1 Tax=Dothistroma septosporum (strain NZE10 / CBS 128990) TaxID=675120 RepID=N1PTV7_DOTSN|nr:hypothetical protein DOTSEDRAFT_71521 [Dothistroma septosporum NZE10]